MPQHKKGKAKAETFTPITNPIEAIQNSIRQHMHRKAEQSHAFICDTRLAEAWDGYSLQSIFPLQSWTDQDRREINKDYRKILSILIIIDWQGLQRKMFRSQFFRQDGRKDANLPFTLEELSFLGTAKELFFDWQHAFKPAVIEYRETKHIQKIKLPARLPFVQKGEQMGIGSYGEVWKVSIARGCYKDMSQKAVTENWSDVKTVAVKKYHSERAEKDFHDEVKRLDYLKEGYHNSRRVMKHIAAIVHGDTFMIVLPLAEHRDLEIFLRCGRLPDPDTRAELEVYNFDDRFKALKDDLTLHRSLIRECFETASALLWLHEELRIYGKLDRYLAHMDLKPDNILIDSEEGHQAGKWMISDFGVSLFDKFTNEPVPDIHSIRDLGRKATSRANQASVHRNQFGYSPPEIDLSKIDGRKCDVWSFVCILCDVLAFALGRRDGLHDFRKVRSNEDDNFFATTNLRKSKTEIDSSNTKVKQSINEWLRNKEVESAYPWVPKFVRVIRQGLVPDPKERPDIRSIMTGLGTISTTISTNTDPLISSTAAQDRRSQQLEIPLQIPSIANGGPSQPTESRRPSISFDQNTLPNRKDDERRPSTAALGANMSDLNDQSRLHTLMEGSDSLVEESASQASASSDNADTRTREARSTQHKHSSSYDTQRSQVVPVSLPLRSSQGEYTRLPPIDAHLPPKTRPVAVALHRSGNHVVMLFKDRVFKCPISNKPNEAKTVQLSSSVIWTRIWTSLRFFAVCGQSQGQQYIEVRDMFNDDYRRSLRASHEGRPYSQFALSDLDIAVCTYGRHIHLAYLQDQTLDSRKMDIDDGYSIKAAEFSAGNNTLCVWAIRSVESKVATCAPVDIVYFFNVTISPPHMIGKGTFEKAVEASIDFHLMPFPYTEACVIREQNGGMFIAHPYDLLGGSKPNPRLYAGIPHALSACVASGDVLVCVEKHQVPGLKRKIYEYQLERKTSGSLYIGKASEPLGSVERIVDEKTQIAVRLTEEGKQMLVLCTPKGEVLRYMQLE